MIKSIRAGKYYQIYSILRKVDRHGSSKTEELPITYASPPCNLESKVATD